MGFTGRRPLPRALVVRLALIVLVAVVAGAGAMGDWRAGDLLKSGTLGVLTTSMTALFSLDAACANRGRMRWGWALIATYMVIYSAADLLWVAFAGPTPSTVLSVADALYLVAFVPGTIGLLVMPVLHAKQGMWRPMMLDASVLALAVVYITHTLVLRTVFAADMDTAKKIILAAYPIGAGLAASLALLVLLRSGGPRRPDVILIGAAFAVLAAADNGNALLEVRGQDSGGTFVAVAYTLAPLLIAAAASVAATIPLRRRDLRRHLGGVVSPLLPDLTALGALLVGVVLTRDVFSTVWGVATIVAVGLRQAAQTRDGWRLRAELEERIEVRTRELDEVTEAYRQLDTMKHEFVTAVSHELRTPLAAIRGSLEMLHDGDAGELPPSARPMIAVASRGSERLSRLVDDIIDLERLQSGTFGFKPATHEMADLVAEATESLGPLAEQQQVELHVETTGARAWCDPDRVVQVLVNLLANALKFSEPGTDIVVTARQSGDTVVVAVKDQGRGIPAEELEAIFDRFHQVDMDASRQGGGTGLGLTICQRIVERHGGRIWAESDTSGATFRFTLPAVAVAPPARVVRERPSPLAAAGHARPGATPSPASSVGRS
jgi:signal transduction histidine kinase